MMPTRIEFRMNVDKAGYRYVAAKPTLRPGQSLLDVPARDLEPERIVGRGGSRIAKRLSEYPMLFTKFAKVSRREELLEFITEYGSLASKNEVGKLLDVASDMKACLRDGRRNPPRWGIADLKASLVKEGGTPTVKFSPNTLLDALWLQLAEALSGGEKLRQCESCHSWFQVGRSGRRLVARFCSDQCRIDFNSLKRSRKDR